MEGILGLINELLIFLKRTISYKTKLMRLISKVLETMIKRSLRRPTITKLQ
mgnify:CR=1 FL=1